MSESLSQRLLGAIAMIDMVLRPGEDGDQARPRMSLADERAAIRQARKIACAAKRMARREEKK